MSKSAMSKSQQVKYFLESLSDSFNYTARFRTWWSCLPFMRTSSGSSDNEAVVYYFMTFFLPLLAINIGLAIVLSVINFILSPFIAAIKTLVHHVTYKSITDKQRDELSANIGEMDDTQFSSLVTKLKTYEATSAASRALLASLAGDGKQARSAIQRYLADELNHGKGLEWAILGCYVEVVSPPGQDVTWRAEFECAQFQNSYETIGRASKAQKIKAALAPDNKPKALKDALDFHRYSNGTSHTASYTRVFDKPCPGRDMCELYGGSSSDATRQAVSYQPMFSVG